MIRKLILLMFLLGFAQSAYAVPALVRKCPASTTMNGGNNAGTTVTCIFASNAAGNALIIMGQTDLACCTNTLTVADSAGNTYSNVQVNVGDGSNTAAMWVACNALVSGGSNTVTMTSTGSPSNMYVGGAEYSGLDNSSSSACKDQSNQSNQNSTSWASPSVTTTVASEVVIGFASGGVGSGTLTAGSGYTTEQSTNNGGRSPGWEDQILSSTQSLTATFTMSPSRTGNCMIGTFKAAVAATGGAVKKKKIIFY